MIQRVIGTIVNIAADMCQQQVCSPADLDVAVKLGLGYPQGPLAMGAVSAARGPAASRSGLRVPIRGNGDQGTGNSPNDCSPFPVSRSPFPVPRSLFPSILHQRQSLPMPRKTFFCINDHVPATTVALLSEACAARELHGVGAAVAEAAAHVHVVGGPQGGERQVHLPSGEGINVEVVAFARAKVFDQHGVGLEAGFGTE